MEPSGYDRRYGSGQPRSRSPRGNTTDQGRSGRPNMATQKEQIDEEQEYERRRQEELRRQIRLKE